MNLRKFIEVEIVEKAGWDESLHPRDDHGRFGSGGGGSSSGAGKPGSDRGGNKRYTGQGRSRDAAAKLGIETRKTPGGLQPVPRYGSLDPESKGKVAAVIANHRMGSSDTKEYGVKQTVDAIRDAYRAGSGNRAPSEETVKDVVAAHLHFDGTEPKGNDRLDYRDHHPLDVREALTSAFLQGERDTKSESDELKTRISAASQQRVQIVTDRVLSKSTSKDDGVYEVFVADVRQGLDDAYRSGTGDTETAPPAGLLEGIAEQHLGMQTLETRNRDSLDFKEVTDFRIGDAMAAAYAAGEARPRWAPSRR